MDKQFVGITGSVGSGKSTLLNAILGELEILQGNVEVNGVISYAAQDPWIFEGSIKENIVFIEQYDYERYKAVLEACDLEREISLCPFGDSTIIGEKGLSLSNGQKARISLARAVYRKADIYIFDDPLAAVDVQVGKRLLQKCFLRFLRDKIRILVTHNAQFLNPADHILLMEAGTMALTGDYKKLERAPQFRRSLAQPFDNDVIKTPDYIVEQKLERQKIMRTLSMREVNSDRKETKLEGSVKFQTYLRYFRTLQMPWIIFLILFLFIFARSCEAGMEIFISKW